MLGLSSRKFTCLYRSWFHQQAWDVTEPYSILDLEQQCCNMWASFTYPTCRIIIHVIVLQYNVTKLQHNYDTEKQSVKCLTCTSVQSYSTNMKSPSHACTVCSKNFPIKFAYYPWVVHISLWGAFWLRLTSAFKRQHLASPCPNCHTDVVPT